MWIHSTSKSVLLISIFLVFYLNTTELYGSTQPGRIGIKLGYPNFTGLTAEYLVPLNLFKNGLFSLATDYTFFPLVLNNVTVSDQIESLRLKLTYFSIGTNIYYFDKGEKLFTGFSYGFFKFGGNAFGLKGSGYLKDDENQKQQPYSQGKARLDYPIHFFQTTLGYCWTFQNFTVATEMGYCFTSIKNSYQIEVESNKKTYIDEFDSPFLTFPKITLSFGYAFGN